MPRYLGTNYWHNLITQRREFYLRAVLTVPSHCVDATLDLKTERKVLENHQWKHCIEIGTFEDITTEECLDEITHLTSDVCSLSDIKNGIPEKYEWKTELENVNNETIEIVSSSNPESVFSFVSDDLFDLCDPFDDMAELFEKENLSKFKAEKEKDSLEEVLSLDGLRTVRDHIPRLSTLLSRLQPKPVKDPLADDDGAAYTETTCFRNHLELNIGSDDISQQDFNNFETFEKCLLSSDQKGELEEVLVCPSENTDIHRVQELIDVDATVKKCLRNETALPCDNPTSPSLLVSSSVPIPGIEQLIISLSPTPSSPDFLEINKHDKEGDSFDKEALLESPVFSTKDLPIEDVVDSSLKHQIQEVKPITLTDKDIELCLLQQNEKETLIANVWEHERFFDEILALRLPEVGMIKDDQLATSCPAIGEVFTQLQLVEESGLGHVELQLSWDPLVSSGAVMTQAAQVEHLQLEGVSKDTTTVDMEEKFVKYQYCEMTGFQHEEVENKENEVVELNNNINMLTNESEMDVQTTNVSQNYDKVDLFSWSEEIEVADSNDDQQKDDESIQCKIPKEITYNEIYSSKLSTEEVIPDELSEFNPLDEFMMLRSSLVKKKCGKYTDSCTTNRGESTQTANNCEEKKTASSSRIIHVKFEGEFEEVYKALDCFLRPYMDVLKKVGEIPKQTFLTSLSVDKARFLVKQKEKEMEDKKFSASECDLYKALLVVQAVVGAADLLVMCCLEPAIGHLSAFQDKHHKILGNTLDGIRKEMFQFKVSFDQVNVLHPKLASLCTNIEEELKVTHAKVLLVTRRNMPSLMSVLGKALSICTDIHLKILGTDHSDLQTQMKNYNCILLQETAIGPEFPWSLFTAVVEFESTKDSVLSKKCADEDINYIGLRDAGSSLKSNQLLLIEIACDTEVTIIGNRSLNSHKNLIHLLESRHNMTVVERANDSNSSSGPHVDIVVDEGHCIVLHDLVDIGEDWQVESLSRKLAVLGLQCSQCWVIFHSTQSAVASYILPNTVVANICKVEAALANLNANMDTFQVSYKLLIAYNMDQLAGLVRSCCNICVETSKVWTKEHWTRPWITGEPSQAESILTTLPCMNSFSAQLLLYRSSLKSVLTSSLEDLVKLAPELPHKVHLTFHKMVNSDSGLHLRSNSTAETKRHSKEGFQPNVLKMPTDSNTGSKVTVSSDTIEDQYPLPRQTIEGQYLLPKETIEIEDQYHSYGSCRVDDFKEQTATYRTSRDENCDIEDMYLRDQQYEDDSTMNFLKKIENGHSSTQDTNDLSQNSQNVDKPNQYVLAKLEGQAEEGAKHMDDSVVPDFHLQVPTGHTSRSRRVKFDLNDYSGSIMYCGSSPQRIKIPFGRTKTSKDYLINSENSVRKPSYSLILQNKMMSMYKDRGTENLDRLHTHQNNGYFSREHSIVNASRHRLGDIDAIPSFSEFPPANQLDGWMDDDMDSLSSIRHGHGSFSTNRLPPRPSVQRVNIGLAQPLRRDQLQANAENDTKECPAKTMTGWSMEDSPPMDLDPDSPLMSVPRKQRSSRVAYRHEHDERQNRKSQNMLATARSMMQDDFNHILSNDEFSRKRKLTYRPLPGSMSGQTVLSFR